MLEVIQRVRISALHGGKPITERKRKGTKESRVILNEAGDHAIEGEGSLHFFEVF